MKNPEQLRRQLDLAAHLLDEIYASLGVKKPVSQVYLRENIAQVQVHVGAALFQLDCLTGEVEAFHATVPKT